MLRLQAAGVGSGGKFGPSMRYFVLFVLVVSSCVFAQQPVSPTKPAMPGMDMPEDRRSEDRSDEAATPMSGMQMDRMKMSGGPPALMQQMEPHSFIQEIRHHGSSGTSAEPNATPTPMVMTMRGEWMLMLHGNAFINDIQQTGPRSADKFFSTNWVMPMAQRELGSGQLTVRAMFSLEPATITGRMYPLLFQQGETAFGLPIADGQHPHDFFMELAALYDLPLGERTLLSFYAAPIGDPALGPTAYPHRASAAENPVGTLGHHQEDSTHIASDVATVGLTHGIVRVEASGFHGREPDEFRWNVDQGTMDSWSTRVTVQPGQNWSGQYSYGQLKSPEAQFPAEDQKRMTASVMYDRAIHGNEGRQGNWANTALWGRTQSLADGAKENSYLLESTLQFAGRSRVWTRIENAGRSNELLVGEHPLPVGFQERPLAHVAAYTLGYDREFGWVPHLASALGGQITGYGVGTPLQANYGGHPVGMNMFLRLRVF